MHNRSRMAATAVAVTAVLAVGSGAAVATNGLLHDDVLATLGAGHDDRAARDGGSA